MEKGGYIYIMTNKLGGTLYIGVTSDLAQRIAQHKSGAVRGFAQKHGCHTLVYVEHHETIEAAIIREKQMKKWNRAWKLRLINQQNREWKDLAETCFV